MVTDQEARFRRIFRAAHADHAGCARDEWLTEPCRRADGQPTRPIVWSRRNGPWHRVSMLWIGAAPGNAGGLGASDLGAHGTRIPFGGDIAGGNLDVLLGSIGLTRNETFLLGSYNQLPAKGGGEPTAAELAAPVGAYPDSIALLRDTVIATGPRLIVALGNVGLRCLAALLTRDYDAPVGEPRPADPPRPPSLDRLARAGFVRGTAIPWPDTLPPAPAFGRAWRAAWGDDPAFHVLPLLHPSAQNMSPFAGTATAFHRRMLGTRTALLRAVRDVLGVEPPTTRQTPSIEGIYNLPEWRHRIAERHARYDELWRQRGL